ncbi:MAG: hypothetical protein OHK0046_08860 [Anaerolineae bacterium]
MRRIVAFLLMIVCSAVLLSGIPAVNVTHAQPPFQSTVWNAAFYNNTNFSGTPVANVAYSALNFNWPGVPTQANGSPVPGLGADNFSVRFTKTVTLQPGTYTYTITADDRADLYVVSGPTANPVPPNPANPAAGQPFSATFQIQTGGTATIRIDYVEFQGPATLVVVEPTGTGSPTNPFTTPTATITVLPSRTPLPAIPPGAITATVIRASVLNTRDAPSLGGGRLGRILRGETYAILGRNEDATWFLLQLGGYQAWAYGYYLFVNGNEFNPPIVSGNSVIGLAGQPDYGVRGQTNAILRLRETPSVAARQTGRITWGAFLPIIGRTSDGFWYQVVWKGTVGWAYSPYIDIIEGDLNNVPVS